MKEPLTELGDKAFKILNANAKGTVQLDAAEANWIAMHAAHQAMEIANALKASKVPLAKIREATTLQNGLANLSNKANRALQELTEKPKEKSDV